ncbi:zinc-dependent alcohol dehydrogenase family protein [Trichloromonas sp.]|uniref:zinc-dependent alcohol dehydrogenase family protein n=1 Tax=Trichloromonas sp. TaxID=3069249 RepID=UPI003D817AE7
MRAMVLETGQRRLQLKQLPVPQPSPGQLLIRVHACGVCRTDLHIVDQELSEAKLPLIPGHEIVGTVVKTGDQVTRFRPGERVGVPWLGTTCGECRYCRREQENLCDHARFTGYTLDGGFAEFTLADQHFCFHLPPGFEDTEAAPLLCAGLIGYRTYRLAGNNIEHLGLYGFGAAAHIVAQIAVHQGKKVYAFTRPGDTEAQEFARRLGAVWAGASTQMSPQPLDAALIFAPAGELIPAALKATDKGGHVVAGGIHMSDIPAFPYRLLWEERKLSSVANLTRRDGEELLELAYRIPVRTEIERFPLEQANEALDRLRSGRVEGAAVLVMN